MSSPRKIQQNPVRAAAQIRTKGALENRKMPIEPNPNNEHPHTRANINRPNEAFPGTMRLPWIFSALKTQDGYPSRRSEPLRCQTNPVPITNTRAGEWALARAGASAPLLVRDRSVFEKRAKRGLARIPPLLRNFAACPRFAFYESALSGAVPLDRAGSPDPAQSQRRIAPAPVLLRAARTQHRLQCVEDDVDIQRHGDVLDVIQIVFQLDDRVFERVAVFVD